MRLPVIGITGRADQSARPSNLPLFAIAQSYVQAVEMGGGTSIVILPHLEEAKLHVIFEPLNGLALSGGGDILPTPFGEGELGVNSTHHQAVKNVAAGLVVTARAPDGIIEGLEAPEHPFCVGVQWHAEVMVESHPAMRRPFEGLVEAARDR
jgi:gamma-glutamyl-gamma-aminobutyrate hydrolase PuuD